MKGIYFAFIFFIQVGLVETAPCGSAPFTKMDSFLARDWVVDFNPGQESIICLTQSADGFLWIGCQKGLYRYDGVNSLLINSETHPLLKNDRIHFLHAEGEDIWFGTLSGLYRLKGGHLKNVFDRKLDVTCFLMESPQRLWFGTYGGGLFSFDGNDLTNWSMTESPGPKYIWSLSNLEDDAFFVGTLKSGLYKFHGSEIRRDSEYSLPENVNVFSQLQTTTGLRLFGTNQGLFVFRDGGMVNWNAANGLPSNQVFCLLEDREGQVWLGTQNGLVLVGGNLFSELGVTVYWKESHISCLLLDREENIWVGTQNQGLKQMRRPLFENVLDDPAQNILAVYQDSRKDIWVGTSNGLFKGGLTPFQRQNLDQELKKSGKRLTWVRSIQETRDGSMWIGTEEHGLFRMEEGGHHYVGKEAGLLSDTIKSLYTDSNGVLWVGTSQGAFVRSDVGFEGFAVPEPKLKSSVYAFLEDSRGRFWMGTPFGVFKFEQGPFAGNPVFFTTESPALTIQEGPDASILIGSFGKGLFVISEEHLHRFGVKDGLNSDYVTGVSFGPSDRVWLGTGNGVAVFPYGNLLNAKSGNGGFLNVRFLGLADGLKSLECSSRSPQTTLMASDQTLWVGTTKGLARLTNGLQNQIEKPIPPVILSIHVNGTRYTESHQLDEPLGGGMLQFDFVTPTFQDTQAVTYEYRLEPIESRFNMLVPGSPNLVRYSNLEAGSYTFILKARVRGQWSEPVSAKVTMLSDSRISFWIWVLLAGILGTAGLYVGVRKKSTTQQVEKYGSNRLSSELVQSYVVQIKKAYECDEVFRDEKLTMRTLAQQLNIPNHHLSQTINDQLGKSFFDLTNFYRIEAAKKRLSSEAETRVSEIFYEVGFNSKAAFYRAFKKQTGLSPTEYRKQCEG